MPDVMFTGPEGRLEGRYHQSKEEHAPIALILHPHPQYGGTMNHKVVFSLFHVFVNRGFSVLRFNTRGVGRSQGRFDNGMGELSDAAAALDWLQSMNADAEVVLDRRLLVRRLDRHAAPDAPAGDRLLHLGGAAGQLLRLRLPRPFARRSGLIVGAEKDEVVPLADIQKLVARLSLQKGITVESRTIKGANHFFHDSLDKLAVDVDKYVAKSLLNPPGRARTRNQAGLLQGSSRRPPVSGRGAPVVPGNVSGRPRRERTARNAKACASSASPSQPRLSAVTTLPRVSSAMAAATSDCGRRRLEITHCVHGVGK